jgi:hypothetical protein
MPTSKRRRPAASVVPTGEMLTGELLLPVLTKIPVHHCLARADGDHAAPHIRNGEYAVIDVRDLTPRFGAPIACQYRKGGMAFWFVASADYLGLPAEMCMLHPLERMKAPQLYGAINGENPALRNIRMSDGPCDLEHLRESMLGVIVGIYRHTKGVPLPVGVIDPDFRSDDLAVNIELGAFDPLDWIARADEYGLCPSLVIDRKTGRRYIFTLSPTNYDISKYPVHPKGRQFDYVVHELVRLGRVAPEPVLRALRRATAP